MPNQHTTKGQPKRTRIVLVRLTVQEHKAVMGHAKKRGMSLSDHIRAALGVGPTDEGRS